MRAQAVHSVSILVGIDKAICTSCLAAGGQTAASETEGVMTLDMHSLGQHLGK